MTHQRAMIAAPQTVASVFNAHRQRFGGHVPLVATSGAFDPLHLGHLKCLQASVLLKGDNGLFVVIVNGDEFLIKKKGYVFMPIEERLELIAAISDIDFVVSWQDDTSDVGGAIKIIKPNIFTKGGETFSYSKGNVPEREACDDVGCSIVFGIGGHTKIQSSSELVRKMQLPNQDKK